MIKSSFVILAEMITGNISALFKAYVLHGLLLYTLFVVTYFIKSGNVFLNVLLLAVFLLFASWSKLYVYTAVSKG